MMDCPHCQTTYPVTASMTLQCCMCGGIFSVHEQVVTVEPPRQAFEYTGALSAQVAGFELGFLNGRLISWANRHWQGYISSYIKTVLQCVILPNRAFASIPVRSDPWGPLGFALCNVIPFVISMLMLTVFIPEVFMLKLGSIILPMWRLQTAFLASWSFILGVSAMLSVFWIGLSIGATHLASLVTGGAREGIAGSYAAACYGSAYLPLFLVFLLFPTLALLWLFFAIYLPILAISRVHGIGVIHGLVVWLVKMSVYVGLLFAFLTALTAGFIPAQLQAMG